MLVLDIHRYPTVPPTVNSHSSSSGTFSIEESSGSIDSSLTGPFFVPMNHFSILAHQATPMTNKYFLKYD